MATNKELEKQVIAFTEKVNQLEEHIKVLEKKIANLTKSEKDEEVITALAEITVELIEVTKPSNPRHDVLKQISSTLHKFIPKRSA